MLTSLQEARFPGNATGMELRGYENKDKVLSLPTLGRPTGDAQFPSPRARTNTQELPHSRWPQASPH